MNILHYNIFNNFERDASRIQTFLEWVDAHAPDVIALNEYMPEDDARLDANLAEKGYVHAAVNQASPRGLRCAIFSKRAFDEHAESDCFRFLRVRISGLDLMSYHASPEGVRQVLAELEQLRSHLVNRRDLILVGDFNSLASADRERFGYEQPGAILPARYLLNGVASYAFIEGLEALGLHDLNVPPSKATIPGGIPRPAEGGFTARIDHAFGRLDSWSATSQVLRDPLLDPLSDHYPLLLKCVQMPKKSAKADLPLFDFPDISEE